MREYSVCGPFGYCLVGVLCWGMFIHVYITLADPVIQDVSRHWRFMLVNPRRACAVRVTVVESVCLSVCLCVCLFNISPLECLFVLKTISRTQRATKVKTFVGISLKPLCCRDPALPAL